MMRPLQRLISLPLRSGSLRPAALPPFNRIATPITPLRLQAALRNQSTSNNPTVPDPAKPPPKPSQPLPHKPAPHRNPDEPIYQLTFTCKACQHRSSHTISKQGYHAGTVLITCPGCKNRHLISDHLHIFSDTKVTLEDIMREKGEDIQRGSITPDGDVEFWSKDATAHGEENGNPQAEGKS